ncbi:MAG: tRNA threonylcarbamoyladenosine dehydratase [Prevotella sp.]|nr:tRNA threonylcarbamoyladenosine dehydratase [Prevotella sp.]
MTTDKEIFARSERLLGDEAMQHLAEKRVIVFGVGGVGSWCAEGLVRSGIKHLTIVDADVVCASNINRQLMATTLTLGRPKVEVLRERLLTINPFAEIHAMKKVFNESTVEEFGIGDYDYVVDAIDSLRDKALLILTACQTQAKFFSSMGAALKLDPTRIKVAEFWKVKGDPLARALRNKFKSMKQFPKHHFSCVYSDELLQNRGKDDEADNLSTPNQGWRPIKAQINGSLVHITAIFGFMLAGLVLQDATKG